MRRCFFAFELPLLIMAFALMLSLNGIALADANGTVIDAAEYIDMEAPDCGLQAAIDAAFEAGGGTVNVPEGIYPLRRGLVVKSNVRLVGAGMDKTFLTPARAIVRINLVNGGPDDEGWYRVDTIPDDLDVGSGLILWRGHLTGHTGYLRPAWVTEVDRERNALKFEAPYGVPPNLILAFGDSAALAEDVSEGDTEIHLKNASMFKPGDELTLGTPGNDSRLERLFVAEVRDHTLVLESPAKKDFGAFPEDGASFGSALSTPVFAVFPMIHAWEAADAAVTDLTIKGRDWEKIRPANSRFTLGGIHLYQCSQFLIEQVAVRGWHTDGFSLQAGNNLSIIKCEATENLGHGFHPGTGLQNSIFDENLSEDNQSAGLYYCWHNRGHVMRNNRFVRNRAGGITGLGHPGNRNNLIENNLVAENGGPGIHINGGGPSGNIIRGNIVENNSQSEAGRSPGILISAAREDALEYTVEENIIRDTQEVPTQHVGVEERHGERRGGLNRADANIVRNNSYSGHIKADVIVVGKKTVVEEADQIVVVENRHDPQEAEEAQ